MQVAPHSHQAAAFDAGAAAVRAYSVIMIDGRSGSGKTTLAAEYAELFDTFGQPAQTLHLDSLYPGWGGLAEGSAAVARALKQQWYHPYDWAAAEFSALKISLDPNQLLIIEGCGALTLANLEAARRWSGGAEVASADIVPGGAVRAAAVHAIWIECDEELRRSRSLARDGEMFAPHWQSWAEQERAHYARQKPWLLAGEVLQGD